MDVKKDCIFGKTVLINEYSLGKWRNLSNFVEIGQINLPNCWLQSTVRKNSKQFFLRAPGEN